MALLRRRASRRSCRIHGDNGCEIQGEAGTRERAQDTRVWRRDVEAELSAAPPGFLVARWGEERGTA